MENPNFLEPAGQPTGHIHKFHGTLILAVAIAAMVSYFALASQLPLWPFETPLTFVTSTPTPQASPAKNEESAYINNQFGFSIALPDGWKGYTVNHIKDDIYDVTGKTKTNNGVVDSYQLIELHHPLETADNPREVMPVMIFTHAQWEHIFNEEWSVGAAPIPPSLLGENSRWVFALPARYNYDFKTGWEEVDQLVHTLKAFEPSADTSTWKTYNNTQYGFEFKYPEGWTMERKEPTQIQRFNYVTGDGYLSVEININNHGVKCAEQYYINNPRKLDVGNGIYGDLMLPTSMYDKDLYLLCIDTPGTMFGLTGWGEGKAVDKNLFKQILTTFRFTK